MPKKIPMRMCVACRQMRPKKELIRIVRTPEGAVTLDRTGRAHGRGAYLCDSIDCLSRAVKTRALDRARETRIDESIFDSLREALHAGAKAE